MGRVYNALVRADRWTDGDSPIASRDSNEAHDRGRGAPAEFSAPSAATSPSVTEANIPPIQGRVVTSGKRTYISAESPEFPMSIDSSAHARRSGASPTRHPVSELRERSVAIAFEEPSQISNVRDLNIASRFAAIKQENHLAVERCRTLAVKLLNLADRRKLKTLLITSAEAGEGKTTVATSVAWSLAKHPERRVLLIDANLAGPSVGPTLGINPKRGWLDVVESSSEWTDAVVRIDPNGLYVMTPGTQSGTEPADAMSSRLESLIRELSPRFDLVVVDSSGILESPESRRLAAVLDGAVIVVRAGHTHHSKVTAARKLVPKERRLGVVLNESEADAEGAHRRREKSSLLGKIFGRR